MQSSFPHALSAARDAELAISTITVREVRKGIMSLRSKRREVADQIEVRALGLFDAFGERVLPITRVIADLCAKLLKVTNISMTR